MDGPLLLNKSIKEGVNHMSFFTKVKKRITSTSIKLTLIALLLVAASIGIGAHVAGKAAAEGDFNCDANADVYCGAGSPSTLINKFNNGDGVNSAASIKNIYSWYNISSTDINNMADGGKNGEQVINNAYVTSGGDVYANGKLVATDGVTGGRELLYKNGKVIPGQTYHKVGGTIFYTRAPQVSFVPSSLSAMVVMKNGVFQFAILNACGNAVTGKPPKPAPRPVLVCTELADSLVSTDATNGDETYDFTATAKPTNGAVIDSYNFDFGDGAKQTVNTSAITAKASHQYAPGTWTATVTVNGSDNLQATCTKQVSISKPTPPAGSLVCTDLDLEQGTPDTQGNEQVTLTGHAQASPKDATISSYDFDLGGSFGNKSVPSTADQASTTFTYPAGTDVTANVTVTGTVNGKPFTTTVTSDSPCSKEVKVPSLPQASSIVCEDLAYSAGTADSQGNIPYTFTADAVPTNATIDSYTFSFANSPQSSNVATNSYAPGAQVNVSVTVNGTLENGNKVNVTSAGCAVSFTVPTTPTCTSATGQTYPQGSSQCQTCTSPSGQTYSAGSPQCTPTPPAPAPTTSLPNTGPGDVVGLFSGVSMSGAGLHRILGNRRRRAASRR
jgi:hypothetical protein